MSRTVLLTIVFFAAVAVDVTASSSACKSPTGPAILDACPAGQVHIMNYCCLEEDVYELPAKSCKHAVGPVVSGTCSAGQVVVGNVCCKVKYVYDPSTATCQEDKDVGFALADGSCPRGTSLTKGGFCCENEGVQILPTSVCKSAVGPVVGKSCPHRQVVVGDVCCKAKDVYDPSTATCQKDKDVGLAIKGSCPEGTSLTKGSVCCWNEGVQFSTTNA
ncbi:CC domain-containing protein [Caenorhabditis elegans]|uniref:CC domain-containing protein n=1 Tax=Caenorhabditis elegans TaxID=6239 RepID=P91238_CAEEL|nr:CC domain-containing protein [Caenorhabditis elegans]CCD69011.1 CC domain-containing protein [Caenorhabditis elegans]|eukprot:NP_494364.3 Uncharacterized protein CELE_F08D12.2 [Caenorhabditis elegans]